MLMLSEEFQKFSTCKFKSVSSPQAFSLVSMTVQSYSVTSPLTINGPDCPELRAARDWAELKLLVVVIAVVVCYLVFLSMYIQKRSGQSFCPEKKFMEMYLIKTLFPCWLFYQLFSPRVYLTLDSAFTFLGDIINFGI